MAIYVLGKETLNTQSQGSLKQTCEEHILIFHFQMNRLIRGKLNLINLFKALQFVNGKFLQGKQHKNSKKIKANEEKFAISDNLG